LYTFDDLIPIHFKMYEHKKQALAPVHVFKKRMYKNFFYVLIFISFIWSIGIIGYHFIAGIPWIDAMHNAAMILSGMGPVVIIENTSGKIFSSLYAIFSGIAFVTSIGFILAPMAHRLFHSLNIEE
jgi:ABC-type phosphate transport system permease subunit